MDHHNVLIIYFAIISYYAEICHKIIRQRKSPENETFLSREDLLAWLWTNLGLVILNELVNKPSDWQEGGGGLYVGGVGGGSGGEYSPRVSPLLPQLSPSSIRCSQYFLLHIFTFQSLDIQYSILIFKLVLIYGEIQLVAYSCTFLLLTILFFYEKCYWWSFLSISRLSSY